ncbi:MAG: nuclease-related domain-containing protein [Woeseiaceae bacterium]|nr:nuclease-related domain-containing protein [Woeseiaceae bacterium]
MNEFLSTGLPSISLFAIIAGVLMLAVLMWYTKCGKPRTLESILNNIAYERIDGLIIPKIDDGEIQIDHLVLTAQGILIIDIKEVQGAVFGSDKMDSWTVIADDKRFTFNNPQPALYERIAAVKQIVRQVPVAGKVVFLDGAVFTKGVPSLVINLDQLHSEFGDWDEDTAKVNIEAFVPHWEEIKAWVAS